MKISVITIFPEMFPGPLGFSNIGSGLKEKIWDLEVISLRDYGVTKHKNVDDCPFGGGAGMVIRADILDSCLEEKFKDDPRQKLYMSPRGTLFENPLNYSKSDGFIILCGRFEGVDQRVIDYFNFTEVSIGDYVLSGGELAAMVVIDSIVRHLPGVLGNASSSLEESFSISNSKTLEYPHYTRPQVWKGISVPDVLLSGHHDNIRKWRLSESIRITMERRPDLMEIKK
jgi:tRNA (guanine37-N1)-methyltransferase